MTTNCWYCHKTVSVNKDRTVRVHKTAGGRYYDHADRRYRTLITYRCPTSGQPTVVTA